jgi:recombination protein RecR
MYPLPIKKLIDLFAKFPTVGPRTASRFVFYLLGLSLAEREDLIATIQELKKIKHCSLCFNPSEKDPCEICENPNRDRSLLCVVEKETDLATLEKTHKYHGLYFILGGTLSKFKKEDLENLRVKELLARAKDKAITEIIIAMNPTTEGEATTLYLERTLKTLDKKTTRLGRGLPIGAELEYADDETLGSALESRK